MPSRARSQYRAAPGWELVGRKVSNEPPDHSPGSGRRPSDASTVEEISRLSWSTVSRVSPARPTVTRTPLSNVQVAAPAVASTGAWSVHDLMSPYTGRR